MAKPGTQCMMQKDLFLRVQNALNDDGIQFHREDVRLKLEGEHYEHLGKSHLNTIAGEAADIIEDKPEAGTEGNHDER